MVRSRTFLGVGLCARLAACLAMAGFATIASAQWVTFVDETGARIVSDPSLGASDIDEKDYAWGDLDQDGDIDLVGSSVRCISDGSQFREDQMVNCRVRQ